MIAAIFQRVFEDPSAIADGSIAKKIFDDLTETAAEELRLLESIKSDTGKLTAAALKTGIDLLHDSMNASSSETRRRLVDDARLKFTEASHLESPLVRPKAQALVGLTYVLVEEGANAESWLRRALSSCEEAGRYLRSYHNSCLGPKGYAHYYLAGYPSRTECVEYVRHGLDVIELENVLIEDLGVSLEEKLAHLDWHPAIGKLIGLVRERGGVAEADELQQQRDADRARWMQRYLYHPQYVCAHLGK